MQEILPPETASAVADASASASASVEHVPDGPLPADLEFTPVPRQFTRVDGWTDDKQRGFIRGIIACGSVSAASRAVGMASSGAYFLRRCEGAESFVAAWDKAVAIGANRVLDVLTDHAINGEPVPIMFDGKKVGEYRRYNYRMMMWIVAHNMPERFGVAGGLMHHGGGSMAQERLKEIWKREWEAEAEAKNLPVERKETADKLEWIRGMITQAKLKQLSTVAQDPEKRAAWEVLYGAVDWAQYE